MERLTRLPAIWARCRFISHWAVCFRMDWTGCKKQRGNEV